MGMRRWAISLRVFNLIFLRECSERVRYQVENEKKNPYLQAAMCYYPPTVYYINILMTTSFKTIISEHFRRLSNISKDKRRFMRKNR